VAGVIGSSSSFNLWCVNVNLFYGNSSPYMRHVPQFFFATHAPNKGPSTYYLSTKTSLCSFGPSFFSLCHYDFYFDLLYLVRASPAYGLTLPSLHVLVAVNYLCILVWCAIRHGVRLFRLVLQVVTIVPHPSKPLALF
jgi:hypothetical protein